MKWKYLKQYFDLRIKFSRYQQWYDNIVLSAMYKSEQFLKDHGRPMTHSEKMDWLNEKRKLLED